MADTSNEGTDGAKKVFEHTLGLCHVVDKTQWRTELPDCFKIGNSGNTAQNHLPGLEFTDNSMQRPGSSALDFTPASTQQAGASGLESIGKLAQQPGSSGIEFADDLRQAASTGMKPSLGNDISASLMKSNFSLPHLDVINGAMPGAGTDLVGTTGMVSPDLASAIPGAGPELTGFASLFGQLFGLLGSMLTNPAGLEQMGNFLANGAGMENMLSGEEIAASYAESLKQTTEI